MLLTDLLQEIVHLFTFGDLLPLLALLPFLAVSHLPVLRPQQLPCLPGSEVSLIICSLLLSFVPSPFILR